MEENTLSKGTTAQNIKKDWSDVWSIDNVQLKAVWEKFYQRMVAVAWTLQGDEGKLYREKLSANTEEGIIFRDREFKRIRQVLMNNGALCNKAEFPEGMPTWVDNNARLRTDFWITPAGMVFPWPEMPKPTINRIREAYNLMGGLLPQKDLIKTIDAKKYLAEILDWHTDPKDYKPIELSKETVDRTTAGDVLADAMRSGNWLGGKDMEVFAEKTAKVVALAWDNQQYRDEFLNPENGAKRKFADTSLTDGIKVTAWKQSNILGKPRLDWHIAYVLDVQSFKIEEGKWEIKVVYPEQPSEQEMLAQMAIGAVSNPLYSNCHTPDCF